MKLAKLSTYIRRLFQSAFVLAPALAVAACAFEPASEGAPEPTASVEQALQGCGVEVINSWATVANGGVWVTAKFKNYGASSCPIRWQFQVRPEGSSTSVWSAVYPLPSNQVWYTAQPGVQFQSTAFLANSPMPNGCKFRTWLWNGPNSNLFVDTWLPCF